MIQVIIQFYNTCARWEDQMAEKDIIKDLKSKFANLFKDYISNIDECLLMLKG